MANPDSPGESPARRRRVGASGPKDQARSASDLTVLVVATDGWAAEQSANVLRSAGHRVLMCHQPGEAPFPCNALTPGRICPLDVGFDVVLTARARPSSEPTAGEMGVICALHAGAPLVTAGILAKNPFTPWTAVTVGSTGDLSEACEAAVKTGGADGRQMAL